MATDAWLDGTANWDTPSDWSAGVPGSTRSWPTWSSVRSPMPRMQVMYFEDLATEMCAAVSKLITERDVEMFAAVSTDTNPIHLSDEFAAGTRFKRRIAHGLLTASLISAALGTKLPGPGAIYVSQNLKFTAPVYLGDVVTATVTLVTLDSLHRYARFDCVCRVWHKMVLSGDAVLYVPNRPAELAA
jgi:3-hydroxybutyryl-CoA dehydratase